MRAGLLYLPPMKRSPQFPYRAIVHEGVAETSDSLGASDEINIFSLVEDGIGCVAGIGRSRIDLSRAHFPEHVHPHCLEIHYCLRGSLVFKAEGETYRCMPGHVFLTQPKDRHHLVERQRGQRHIWLLFRFPTTRDGNILDLPSNESRLLCRRLAGIRNRIFPADAALRDLFQEVFDICESEPRGLFRTIVLKSLIMRILLVILRSAEHGGQPPSSVNARLDEVIREIRDNPTEKRTIEELARRAALSESRFSYLFKHATGLPPHAFMASCRLAEAKRRLEATGDPIAKIAQDTGFSSSRHLATQFRQFNGMSPRQFRAKEDGNGTGHPLLPTVAIE